MHRAVSAIAELLVFPYTTLTSSLQKFCAACQYTWKKSEKLCGKVRYECNKQVASQAMKDN